MSNEKRKTVIHIGDEYRIETDHDGLNWLVYQLRTKKDGTEDYLRTPYYHRDLATALRWIYEDRIKSDGGPIYGLKACYKFVKETADNLMIEYAKAMKEWKDGRQ